MAFFTFIVTPLYSLQYIPQFIRWGYFFRVKRFHERGRLSLRTKGGKIHYITPLSWSWFACSIQRFDMVKWKSFMSYGNFFLYIKVRGVYIDCASLQLLFNFTRCVWNYTTINSWTCLVHIPHYNTLKGSRCSDFVLKPVVRYKSEQLNFCLPIIPPMRILNQ